MYTFSQFFNLEKSVLSTKFNGFFLIFFLIKKERNCGVLHGSTELTTAVYVINSAFFKRQNEIKKRRTKRQNVKMMKKIKEEKKITCAK